MTCTTPARTRLAVLVVVALAVSWIAMYAMHVGMGGMEASAPSMAAAAQSEPARGAAVAEGRVFEIRSVDQPSTTPASVRAPAQRCEALDARGVVPRSGSALVAVQAFVPGWDAVPSADLAVEVPGGVVRSLPPPSLDLLSISRT